MQTTGDSKVFEVWASNLRIKTANCVHSPLEALTLMVMLLDNGYNYDGLSFFESFKPKVVTYHGEIFLQATLRQGSDLLLGVYFPCPIKSALIAFDDVYEDLYFEKTAEEGFYNFPTPFATPFFTRVKILVRFSDIRPEHYPFIPFTLKNAFLKSEKKDEFNAMHRQIICWLNHGFHFVLDQRDFTFEQHSLIEKHLGVFSSKMDAIFDIKK